MLFSNDKHNEILFSILWGIGFAVLFRKLCKNKKCIVIQAPNNFDVRNQIFRKTNGKCYKLIKHNDSCFT